MYCCALMKNNLLLRDIPIQLHMYRQRVDQGVRISQRTTFALKFNNYIQDLNFL